MLKPSTEWLAIQSLSAACFITFIVCLLMVVSAEILSSPIRTNASLLIDRRLRWSLVDLFFLMTFVGILAAPVSFAPEEESEHRLWFREYLTEFLHGVGPFVVCSILAWPRAGRRWFVESLAVAWLYYAAKVTWGAWGSTTLSFNGTRELYLEEVAPYLAPLIGPCMAASVLISVHLVLLHRRRGPLNLSRGEWMLAVVPVISVISILLMFVHWHVYLPRVIDVLSGAHP